MSTASQDFLADFDAVYDEFRSIARGTPINAATLVTLLMECLVLVERISKQSKDHGSQKKALALRLLQRLIEDNEVITRKQRAQMIALLNTMVPPLIDAIIAIDKHQLFERVRSCCK